jgi:hypothetical protein
LQIAIQTSCIIAQKLRRPSIRCARGLVGQASAAADACPTNAIPSENERVYITSLFRHMVITHSVIDDSCDS